MFGSQKVFICHNTMRKIPQKFLNVGVRLFSGSLEATLSARYVNDVMIFPIVNDVIMFPFKTIFSFRLSVEDKDRQ